MSVEGIQFSNFNSVNERLSLLLREAPTPEEKKISESLPYMQGELNFSMIMGERVFENREIYYEFTTRKSRYKDRKTLENRIKRLVMVSGEANLYDTHDKGFIWRGQCSSVEVEDDAQFNKLIVKMTFNVYPYMRRVKSHFDDDVRTFNLENDIACYTKFNVDGTRTIVVVNPGDTTVKPIIYLEGVE